MSQAVKRVSQSSVNWQRLSERLTPQHAQELARLKGQNSIYSSQVNSLPADLPKVDFAALKKQMPSHANLLDQLQKQYEAVKVPYGTIPDKLNIEIEKWTQFNELRTKLHEQKTADGAEEAKKVEDKWAKAPPIEHFNRQHFAEYFPGLYVDYRYENNVFVDLYDHGYNRKPELRERIEKRFADYKVLRRENKEEGH
ncbi:Protein ATP-5 [Aphelenchoides avenae]|nr:Protein ATP-5 [Aphelenchus avenae]